MAHLAWRYTQDLAVAADDGDRRCRHRRRNLFARADRSLERVTGAGDKLYRAMARRRCAALPPPWLSRRPEGKSSLRVRFRNATGLLRTRPKRMWRLGSIHCRKRGAVANPARRSNRSPANASARSGELSIKSIRREETGHAGQFRKVSQFQFDVGFRTFG